MRHVLADAEAPVGTDGTLVCGVPHPRAAKTFPRILHYAHEGLTSFEKAIEMMSDRDVRTLSKLDRGTI